MNSPAEQIHHILKSAIFYINSGLSNTSPAVVPNPCHTVCPTVCDQFKRRHSFHLNVFLETGRGQMFTKKRIITSFCVAEMFIFCFWILQIILWPLQFIFQALGKYCTVWHQYNGPKLQIHFLLRNSFGFVRQTNVLKCPNQYWYSCLVTDNLEVHSTCFWLGYSSEVGHSNTKPEKCLCF